MQQTTKQKDQWKSLMNSLFPEPKEPEPVMASSSNAYEAMAIQNNVAIDPEDIEVQTRARFEIVKRWADKFLAGDDVSSVEFHGVFQSAVFVGMVLTATLPEEVQVQEALLYLDQVSIKARKVKAELRKIKIYIPMTEMLKVTRKTYPKHVFEVKGFFEDKQKREQLCAGDVLTSQYPAAELMLKFILAANKKELDVKALSAWTTGLKVTQMVASLSDADVPWKQQNFTEQRKIRLFKGEYEKILRDKDNHTLIQLKVLPEVLFTIIFTESLCKDVDVRNIIYIERNVVNSVLEFTLSILVGTKRGYPLMAKKVADNVLQDTEIHARTQKDCMRHFLMLYPLLCIPGMFFFPPGLVIGTLFLAAIPLTPLVWVLGWFWAKRRVYMDLKNYLEKPN